MTFGLFLVWNGQYGAPFRKHAWLSSQEAPAASACVCRASGMECDMRLWGSGCTVVLGAPLWTCGWGKISPILIPGLLSAFPPSHAHGELVSPFSILPALFSQELLKMFVMMKHSALSSTVDTDCLHFSPFPLLLRLSDLGRVKIRKQITALKLSSCTPKWLCCLLSIRLASRFSEGKLLTSHHCAWWMLHCHPVTGSDTRN